MRQDSVGANAQVSENGTHVNGSPTSRAQTEHARGGMVERRLFSLWLSCTFNNLQVADGCVGLSNYVQVRRIVGCVVGCGQHIPMMVSKDIFYSPIGFGSRSLLDSRTEDSKITDKGLPTLAVMHGRSVLMDRSRLACKLIRFIPRVFDIVSQIF